MLKIEMENNLSQFVLIKCPDCKRTDLVEKKIDTGEETIYALKKNRTCLYCIFLKNKGNPKMRKITKRTAIRYDKQKRE